MKKITLIGMIILLIGLASLQIAKADSDTFKLTMGTVRTFTTEPKRYAEGNFFVDMSFDKWYDSSCTNGQVQITLEQLGSSRALGSIQKNIYLYTTLHHTFGYFGSVEKYYTFYRVYCGWVSNTVRIGS